MKQIKHNNLRENAKRILHQYAMGNEVMIQLAPNQKHGEDQYSGPHRITEVNNNGTVTLSKAVDPQGTVLETWNIHQLDPCMA